MDFYLPSSSLFGKNEACAPKSFHIVYFSNNLGKIMMIFPFPLYIQTLVILNFQERGS